MLCDSPSFISADRKYPHRKQFGREGIHFNLQFQSINVQKPQQEQLVNRPSKEPKGNDMTPACP